MSAAENALARYADAKLRHMERARFLDRLGMRAAAETERAVAQAIHFAIAAEREDPQPEGLPIRGGRL